jgi:hypothetical protein
MRNLELYIKKHLPEGMAYEDATDLCLYLYCNVENIPKEFLPLSRRKMANIFAELATTGWIRGLDNQVCSHNGGQFQTVKESGHWIKVMASLLKKGGDMSGLVRGRELARKCGFGHEQKSSKSLTT